LEVIVSEYSTTDLGKEAMPAKKITDATGV